MYGLNCLFFFLVFGDNNWSVVNTWNTEQMSSEKSVICCQLALHMVNENHDTMRGTMGTIMTWALTELQTMMESAPSVSNAISYMITCVCI